jgi:hypothetical protein
MKNVRNNVQKDRDIPISAGCRLGVLVFALSIPAFCLITVMELNGGLIPLVYKEKDCFNLLQHEYNFQLFAGSVHNL